MCCVTDLGSMIADVIHPDLVSLQPSYGGEDFMDTVEPPSLRIGTVNWLSYQYTMSEAIDSF